MAPAAMGLLIGFAGAAAVSRTLERLLYGVSIPNAETSVTMSLLPTVVALLACFVPVPKFRLTKRQGT